MSDIGPGDMVECVDASPRDAYPCPLVEGAIYQVASFNIDGGVVLKGFSYPIFIEGSDGSLVGVEGFSPRRFRPLRRPPNPELIESLKRPAREPVKEDA